MDQNQIDDVLKRTLSDFRVSRGERKLLEGLIRQYGAADHQIGVLRSRAFDVARAETTEPQTLQLIDWLEDVVKVFQIRDQSALPDAEAYFSPGSECLNAIRRQFEKARHSADVCVFTITDNRISDAIRDAHARGVKIRVISDNDKSHDKGSDIQRLENLGIAVRVDRTNYNMHHKYAVFDEKTTLTGSYNWTRSAAEYNEENFVITADSRITREFLNEFEKLWKSLS